MASIVLALQILVLMVCSVGVITCVAYLLDVLNTKDKDGENDGDAE